MLLRMAPLAQLTQDVLQLSEAERARLAQTLLESLEPAPDTDVEQSWEAEIARRLQPVRDGSAKGRPAEEVFRDLEAERRK